MAIAIRIHACIGRGIGDTPPTYYIAANAATSSYKLRYPKAYRITCIHAACIASYNA